MLDSALLMYMWGVLFGLLQGIAVCEAEGLSLDTFGGFVKAVKPMIDGAVDDMVARVKQKRYAADEQTLASLGAHYGAFRHLLETCREHGLHREIPEAMGRLFGRAVEQGKEEDDFAALYGYLRG